jgi:hypothetical protein
MCCHAVAEQTFGSKADREGSTQVAWRLDASSQERGRTIATESLSSSSNVWAAFMTIAVAASLTPLSRKRDAPHILKWRGEGRDRQHDEPTGAQFHHDVLHDIRIVG